MSRTKDVAVKIAKAARDAAITKGVEAIREQLPDVSVSAIEEGIELKARGLARRLVVNPVLRWIGKILK